MTSAEPHVATAAIQCEVSGRETEILSALGIPWIGGSQHITCPYPTHADNHPSWRWDAVKGRAYCTCTPSGSIFDVIRKVKGVGFEQAKIMAAEIIGRPDLIIERNARPYSRFDAASLLDPAPENKDNDLCWRYLAHRLDVEPNMVPRPFTKVVGIKQLAYFDAPRHKDDKPLHIGDFPAAVFETVDRNDCRHAHRIYLAAGGFGKAELGLCTNGTPRDPKKSARKIGNETTAGRAVIWGDPLKAETEIICEGIETATAVAFAFGAEVTSRTVMVAACITAAGVQAFKPWPAAKHVIVGADRDEFSEQGKPPSRRGEIAAQKFAQLHHGEIAISIALPGRPGEKIDWLNVLKQEGVELVRRGISDAVSIEGHSQGNSLETKESRCADDRAKQADVIMKLARKGAELFHTPEGISFADVRVEGIVRPGQCVLGASSYG